MNQTWMSPGAGTRLFLLSLVTACTALSGCIQVAVTKPAWPGWMETKPEAPPCGPAKEAVAIWQNGVVVQPDPANGGAPTPGFLGKVFLVGMEDMNVEADGTLTVQLYDDLQEPSNPPRPREMWIISADILKTVLRKESMLGWNYTLWLPWSHYSPKVSKVTLVVQHKDKNGHEVWSKPHFMTVRDQEGIRQPPQMQVSSMEHRPGGK